ncbi:MAG: trehalose-phosphatase [Beijerinckiaceae bacterium]
MISSHFANADSGFALDVDAQAFLFDLDGTLVDIAPRPQDVRVSRGLVRSLSQLRTVTGGAVAVVSGRRLDSVDALLAPLKLAGAGIHGLEWRSHDGVAVQTTGPAALPVGLREKAADLVKATPGLALEDKGSAIAIHYRAKPEHAKVVRAFAALVAREHPDEVVIQTGKMVTELRLPGPHKGDAVRRLMRSSPFKNRQPVYFGDDLTDEPAMEAVQAIGGVGVRIGDDERQTRALLHLPTPCALRIILTDVLAGEKRFLPVLQTKAKP